MTSLLKLFRRKQAKIEASPEPALKARVHFPDWPQKQGSLYHLALSVELSEGQTLLLGYANKDSKGFQRAWNMSTPITRESLRYEASPEYWLTKHLETEGLDVIEIAGEVAILHYRLDPLLGILDRYFIPKFSLPKLSNEERLRLRSEAYELAEELTQGLR